MSPHIHVRKPQPGSRPGTLVIPPDSPAPRIHVIDYTRDNVTETDVTEVRDLERYAAEGTISWIDIQGFGDEALLREVARIFSIHPLAMEDVVNFPQRPKVDAFPPNALVVSRMIRPSEDQVFSTEQISLVLGPSYVITFQEKYGDILEPVRRRLREGLGPMRGQGPDYLSYALLDRLVDAFYPVLDTVGDSLMEIEEGLIAEASSSIPARLHLLRRRLNVLRRLIWGQREALAAALKQDSSPFSENVRLYLTDVQDHCVQLIDMVESYREAAVGLMDLQLALDGHRANEVMKVLTIVASIFVPLTFVAGIYGMNFEHMPELGQPWGYPAALVVMGAVAAAMLAYFRYRGWLGRGRKRP